MHMKGCPVGPRRFGAALTLLVALPMLVAAPLRAAELIMLEQQYCSWCERFDEEIGGIYARTAEGRRAPLRRVDIHEDFPDDLKAMKSSSFTPTFVLWHEGREIDRLRGYPGDEFFWTLLNDMLDKLPPDAGVNAAPSAAATN